MLDILQTNAGDILLKDTGAGWDIVWGSSDLQHQRDLLLQRKGDDAWHVEAGVGMEQFLKDEEPENLYSEIRKQFRADGMMVNKIGFDKGKLKIDAKY